MKNLSLLHGKAVLKLVKHCQESLPVLVMGSLLGMTAGNGVLEVTHAFPFPEALDDKSSPDVVKGADEAPSAAVDEEMAALEGHEFQLEMMKKLREVNVDHNCVGWYQSMYLGSYSTAALVETQLSYQTDMSPNAVVILYDPIQTAHGDLVLKCFRLTDECVALKTEENPKKKNAFLDPSKIFEEIPITFTNPGLVRCLLHDLKASDTAKATVSATDTTFDRLDLTKRHKKDGKAATRLAEWKVSSLRIKFGAIAIKSTNLRAEDLANFSSPAVSTRKRPLPPQLSPNHPLRPNKTRNL
eukprot:scaffold3929_cov46-Attheya_sp.AAC.2